MLDFVHSFGGRCVFGLFQLPVLTGVKCRAMTELSAIEASQLNWFSSGDTYGWGRSLSKEQEFPFSPQNYWGWSP